MELREKTFLITGASSGIGAATAREAATRGAHVILVARSQAKLERLAEEIRKTGGNASSYVADLSEPAMIRAVTDTIKAANGTPDIIMNNAGSGIWKYAHETTPEEAAAMVTLPYLAAFGVTHAFLPGLIETRQRHDCQPDLGRSLYGMARRHRLQRRPLGHAWV
jgi:short-subunit dehydrogenase